MNHSADDSTPQTDAQTEASPDPTPAAEASPFAPTKATVSGGYRWRPGLIALFCIGFGFYALYDGFIAYPNQIEQYDKLELIIEKAEAGDPQYTNWRSQEAWTRLAEKHGIEGSITETESYSDRTQGDVVTQFIMAGIVFPIGFYALYIYIASGSRFVEADEQGVRDHKGQSPLWSELTGIDGPKWDTKGIARLVYKTAQGEEGRILLDDWKFDTEPTRAIYREALRHTDPEAYAKEMERLAAREAAQAAAEQAAAEAPPEPGDADPPDRTPTSAA
ncbi:MAG: hypothetical protein AAGI68_03165 [Planctomycetota bacterium]